MFAIAKMALCVFLCQYQADGSMGNLLTAREPYAKR